MTQPLVEYLQSFGYLTVLAAGFAEYAGVPIATVPVLITAGGLSQAAGLNPVLVAASAAAGGLAADLGWFAVVRRRGDDVVDAACGLTSNPDACVLNVEERVKRLGPAYVLPAKFIPGAGNLVAAASALSGMRLSRFAAYDALALLLWAGVYTLAGFLFASQIEGVIDLVLRYQRWAMVGAAALVLGAAAWRGIRIVRHRRGHDDERKKKQGGTS